MPWGAVIGSVVGGIMSSDAASSAASTQANAANQATQAQTQLAQQSMNLQQPWRDVGVSSLYTLSNILGLQAPAGWQGPANLTGQGGTAMAPGSMTQDQIMQQLRNDPTYWKPVGDGTNATQFDQLAADKAAQLQLLQQSNANKGTQLSPFSSQQPQFDVSKMPGYQFQLGQGLGAIENSSAARGMQLSGNTLKDLQGYGQGLASTQYGDYLNRLSSMAGLGQVSAGQAGNTLNNLGGQIGSNMIGAGNALAAGQVGSTNALVGGFGNAYNNYTQQQMLSSIFGGGGAGGYGGYGQTGSVTMGDVWP